MATGFQTPDPGPRIPDSNTMYKAKRRAMPSSLLCPVSTPYFAFAVISFVANVASPSTASAHEQ